MSSILYEANAWISTNTAIQAFQLGCRPLIFVDYETLVGVKVAGGNGLSCCIFSIMIYFPFLVIQKFMKSKRTFYIYPEAAIQRCFRGMVF